MNYSKKLVLPLLAVTLLIAPIRAAGGAIAPQQEEQPLELSAQLVSNGAHVTDEGFDLSSVIQESKKTSLWRNAYNITSGLMWLASAYVLYPHAVNSYKELQARTSFANRACAKGMEKVNGFLWGKKGAQASQLKYTEHLLQAAGPAAGYAVGTVGCAGIGLAYLARGLHLTK